MKCIIETSCKSEVKGVKIKPDRCVAILETKIFIFNLGDFKCIKSIETCPNPKGLGTIANLSDQLILAYPSKTIGFAEIFTESNGEVRTIEAHKSTLCAL